MTARDSRNCGVPELPVQRHLERLERLYEELVAIALV